MTHVTYRLTAKKRDQMRNPTVREIGRNAGAVYLRWGAPGLPWGRNFYPHMPTPYPYQWGPADLVVARDRTHTHTYTRPFDGPLSGTTRVSRYQKGKPICILLEQETVSGSGISLAICKSAPRSRQTTTPAPHHSVFTGPGQVVHTRASVVTKHYNLVPVRGR